jgi:predicted phage baseplate assembly protein
MGGVPGSPVELTLELRSPQGSPRPPRTLRIEPNVVPVEQGRSIVREQQTSNGLPDWSFALAEPGLRFAAGEKPVELEVAEGAGIRAWREVRRLSDHGPGDDVYEFDAAAGRVTFGNGVNGRIPPEGSPVFVSYSVCDGDQGGVARNRRWSVAGFEGAFGVNPDPVAGGAAPRGRIEQRREARRRSRTEHALVSAGDLVDAAEALPLLEVARAWVLVPREDAPRTGVVTLVAMRSRPDGQEPERTPETRRWLEAVRRGLVARVPLGTRLVVAAPRYAEFSVRARLEAEAGREPGDVEKAVRGELARRLAIVAPGAGAPERAPGVPVTRRDVFAWIRAVDGVRSVLDLRLIDAAGQEQDEIAVGRGGLPRVDLPGSDIKAARPGPGTAR